MPLSRSFDSYRQKFHTLYLAIKNTHETSPNKHRGHGLDHDVAVAQMAVYIAPTSRLADSGWIAGLIHSTDRLVGADKFSVQLRTYLDLLPANSFTSEEIEEIYLAALEHSEKLATHRSPTQEVLQDADKLINMQATLFIRNGQYLPDLPAVELSYLEKINPLSTYRTPKSCFDNIRIIATEFPDLIHTEKGKILAAQYTKRIQEFERQVLDDHQLLGLTGIKW